VATELLLVYQGDIRVFAMLAFALNVEGDPANALVVLERAGLPIELGSEFMTGAAD
jgi:hypothetical protein